MKAFLFDTETTGLVKNRTIKLELQPEVIEFYGCTADLKKGKIISEYETFIKPSKELSDTPNFGDKKTITQITGITNVMLDAAPPFAKVAEKIFKLLEGAPVVIAHNASFDKDMIEIEAERLARKIKWPPLVCTVEQTIHMKGFRLSLSNLHLHLFNEPFTGAHRSKADVAALLRCCVELHKREII